MNELLVNKKDILITEDFGIYVNLSRLEDEPVEERDILIRFIPEQNKFKFVHKDPYFFILGTQFKDYVSKQELKNMKKFNKIYNILFYP